VLDEGKEYLVETRLTPLAYVEGFASIEDMLRRLSEDGNGLRRKVLDAMTNNETWFFRDFQPFEALRKEIVPALLNARSATRLLRFWSAACSSGQEPYSLALLWREHFALRNWGIKILATDISSAILERARSGRYSQMEVNRGMPANLLTKYFRRGGLDWEIDGELRNDIEFRPFNLAEPWPEMPKADVIFLRNVMIYFDLETRKRILARVRAQLQPDGFMFLGCAETTLNLDAGFERIAFGNTAYYRMKP
jgi:chemotaxis protein methyltransferase CheR